MSVALPTPIVDVFISYKREDRARVTPILDGLRHAGVGAWWDGDIPAGASWRQTLIEHLDRARCVIVVWSETSVTPAGEFVQEEAARAKSRHVILPLRIDDVTEPLGYGELQSLELINWPGNVDDPRFQDLVAAVKAMIAGGPRPGPKAPSSRARVATGLVDQSISFARGYVIDLLDLTSGPKRFFARRRAALEKGLLFLAVSFLLTEVLQLPLARGNPLSELVVDAVFVSAYVLLYGYALYFAWRLVGASASIQQFLTIHFYLSGVLKLILTTFYIGARGFLRSDRATYDQVMARVYSGDTAWLAANAVSLFEHQAFQLFSLILIFGVASMLVWILIGWGAYRELTGVTKFRSLLAFLIFCLLCVPVYILTFLISAALVS